MTMITLKGKNFYDYETILTTDSFVRLVEQHMGEDCRNYIQEIIDDRDYLESQVWSLQSEIDDLKDELSCLL